MDEIWDNKRTSWYPENMIERAKALYVRSSVDYSWMEEGLDWEGWIAERVAAVRSVR